MPDTDTTDEQPVEPTDEHAEGATGNPAEADSPPWGDDFDPARAWNTIQQQREAEKTLKQQLADANRVLSGEDQDGLRQTLERLGYEFDDDDYTDDDDAGLETAQQVHDPRVDELLTWQQQQAAKEAQQQFEADFKEAVGDREVNDKAREFIVARTVYGGNDPDALKAAVEEWFELTTPPEPPKKQRAAHVPQGGVPNGEPAPAANHQDRVQRALERMQADQAL